MHSLIERKIICKHIVNLKNLVARLEARALCRRPLEWRNYCKYLFSYTNFCAYTGEFTLYFALKVLMIFGWEKYCIWIAQARNHALYGAPNQLLPVYRVIAGVFLLDEPPRL